MTMSISVGKLRQNPTAALDEVESGHEVVVTRNNKEVAKLVPLQRRGPVSADAAAAVFREAPLADGSWSEELRQMRDEERSDPWTPVE